MSHMIKCHLCSYQVSVSSEVFERRISGRKVTLRCKRCRGAITIDGTDAKKPVVVVPQATPAQPKPSQPVLVGDGDRVIAPAAAPTATEPTATEPRKTAEPNPAESTAAPALAPVAAPPRPAVSARPPRVASSPVIPIAAAPSKSVHAPAPVPAPPRASVQSKVAPPTRAPLSPLPAPTPAPAPATASAPVARRNATLLGLQAALPPIPAPPHAGQEPTPASIPEALAQALPADSAPALPVEPPAPALSVEPAPALPVEPAPALPVEPLAPALSVEPAPALPVGPPAPPAVVVHEPSPEPPPAPARASVGAAGELTPASFHVPETVPPQKRRSRAGKVVLAATATLLLAAGAVFAAQRGLLGPELKAMAARIPGLPVASLGAPKVAAAPPAPEPAPAVEVPPPVADPETTAPAPAPAPVPAAEPEPEPAAKEPEPKPEPEARPEPEPEHEVPDYAARAPVLHLTHLAVRRAQNCHRGGRAVGSAEAFVTYEPNGRVSDARLVGEPIASAPVARCVLDELRATKVPRFDGPAFTLKRTITLR